MAASTSTPPPQNLPGLLADIDQTFPALSTQIKDEDGKLRRFINIYVNDEDIRFLGGETYAFQDGDEVMLIPSIAGGSRYKRVNAKITRYAPGTPCSRCLLSQQDSRSAEGMPQSSADGATNLPTHLHALIS